MVWDDKKLKKIKINGREIFRGKIKGTSADISDFNKGNDDDRTIGAGETITIEFIFERSADIVDFGLSADFGSGSVDLI